MDQSTPATPGHIYRLLCTGDCASFNRQNVRGDLPNIPVDAVLVDPAQTQRAFAGTDRGLHFTDNIELTAPTWMDRGERQS